MSKPESKASLTEVASSGDQLETLYALRDVLTASIDCCESKRDLAALSNRLIEVLAQIGEHEKKKPKKGSPLDVLKEKRATKGLPRAKNTRRA